MDKFQKQSIAIMLNSLEQQIHGIRSLLNITNERPAEVLRDPERPLVGYTNKEEDQFIEKAFEPDIPGDRREVFMQDIFKQAHEETIGEHASANLHS